jgi:hypothetical protein
MEEENSKENGCRIYCIYFKNKEDKYDFGEIKGKSEEILHEIAKLGKTEHHYNSNSLIELSNTFKLINEAIKTDYSLKLKKNGK